VAGHGPQVAGLEVAYYQVLILDAGAIVICGSLASFFTGRGETRAVMLVNCSATLLNVVLDYAWIFGRWGFPALGIAGAAWATVVAQWSKVLAYGWLMMRPIYRQKYQLLAGRRFDVPLMRRLLWYGGPNGLQLLVEVSAFTLFILLVGRLGADAMAATTLAFNVNSVAFVPMTGLGIAVTTMVGQQLGRNRPDMAAQATWTAFRIALCYMGAMALLYVSVPNVFLMGHASGTSPEEFAGIRDLTVVLLRFVAVYCLFDAGWIIFTSAIKGAGDTRFILITNLIMSPLPVLAGWLGITYFGGGVIWCWVVITAWICCLGLIFLARFLQGTWRTMRVIEPEAPELADGQSARPAVPVVTEPA
jgi:MATE family multidrug resistance protein